MSTPETTPPPLRQLELSDSDKAILNGLQNWLSGAYFEVQPNNDIQICRDEEYTKKLELLKSLDLVSKV